MYTDANHSFTCSVVSSNNALPPPDHLVAHTVGEARTLCLTRALLAINQLIPTKTSCSKLRAVLIESSGGQHLRSIRENGLCGGEFSCIVLDNATYPNRYVGRGTFHRWGRPSAQRMTRPTASCCLMMPHRNDRLAELRPLGHGKPFRQRTILVHVTDIMTPAYRDVNVCTVSVAISVM